MGVVEKQSGKNVVFMLFLEELIMRTTEKSVGKTAIFITVVLLAWGLSCFAEQNDTYDSQELFNMSPEELMNVSVVSASRLPTQPQYLSAPVTVITAEDIHYSGATTIPEILQFAPGVDVRRLDRQRYAVGVRGLFGVFSDRTLVLIDSRPATDIIYGTTHWENLPVLMDDIERIEIVRGPVGAAWGANAFTGVINIITKKPGETPGGLISTTINEYGDSYTQLLYSQTQGKWSWKASAGYEDVEDSDAAGAGKYTSGTPALNTLMGFDTFKARDWGRFWKFDTQAEYRIDNQTRYSFGAAHSSGQEGDYEFIGVFPRRDILTEYTRMFARMDHQFDKDTSAHIQWFGDYWDNHRRVVTDHTTYMENDLEGQFTFKPADAHTASVGGNVRWNRMSMHNHSTTDEYQFTEDGYDEYWAGIFLIDRWSVTDRFTLEGQVRLDNYSETTTDWSTRFTALYALDEKQNHIVRAGFARAFRSPSVAVREGYADYLQAPVIGGLFLTQQPQDGLDNEGTYSLEAGYTGRLTGNLSLNIDGYYQRMERLIGVTNATDMFGVTTSTFDNVAGADAWGTETSLTWKHKTGKITAWYAYNALRTDEFGQITRSLPPSVHKAGLTNRWYLDKNWTFNTNYVFQSAIKTYGASAKDTHGFHRLDVTLSRKIAKGQGELMIGVADIVNKTTDPVFDTGYLTAHETPGRTLFARLQYSF
jgi:outer membrane cobalamin receptor